MGTRVDIVGRAYRHKGEVTLVRQRLEFTETPKNSPTIEQQRPQGINRSKRHSSGVGCMIVCGKIGYMITQRLGEDGVISSLTFYFDLCPATVFSVLLDF